MNYLRIVILVALLPIIIGACSSLSSEEKENLEYEIYLLNRSWSIYLNSPVYHSKTPPTLADDELEFTFESEEFQELYEKGWPTYQSVGYFPFQVGDFLTSRSIRMGRKEAESYRMCMRPENPRLRYAKTTTSGMMRMPGPDGDFDLSFDDVEFVNFGKKVDDWGTHHYVDVGEPSYGVRYDPTNGIRSSGDLIMRDHRNTPFREWHYSKYKEALFDAEAYKSYYDCYDSEF